MYLQKVSSTKDKIMATIIRQSYIDKIERFLGKVGQRRVGKSCMMKMIRDRKISDSSNNIIYINKEKRVFGNLRAIKDNYPKYVISMTPLLTKNDDDGITHIHLRKFLTEGL